MSESIKVDVQLKERLLALLEEHAASISERWAQSGVPDLPSSHAYDAVSVESGVARPAVLNAVIWELAGPETPEHQQYLLSMVRRWHQAGLIGQAVSPYFDSLREAARGVIDEALGDAPDADHLLRVLDAEIAGLRLQVSDMESSLLGRELRDIRQRLEGLFEHIPGPALLIGVAEGRIRAANDAAVQFTGHDRARLHGSLLGKLVPELDEASFHSFIARVVDGGQSAREGLTLLRDDGVRMDISIDALYVGLGVDPMVLCVLKRTDGARAGQWPGSATGHVPPLTGMPEQQQTFVESVLETLPIRLLLLDENLVVLYANSSYYVQRGLAREDVIGKRVEDIMPSAMLDDAGLRAALLSVLETGERVRWSGYRDSSSQGDRLVNVRLDPCRGPDEEQLILVTLEDITEHRSQLFEREIVQQIAHVLLGELELEKLLYVILTSMTAGGYVGLGFNRAMLLLVDEATNTLRAQMAVGPEDHEQAVEIWQQVSADHHTLQDFLADYDKLPPPDARPLHDLVKRLVFPMDDSEHLPVSAVRDRDPVHIVDAEMDDRVPESLRHILGTNEFVVAPLVARDKTIGVAIADNRFSQEPISHGAVALLRALADQAAMAIDTARAYGRMKDQAERLNRALRDLQASEEERLRNAKLAAIGEVAAIVAHEIRSPLSTIGGFARSILRQPDQVERNARNAQIIAKEVARLEKILRDLLDFSKPTEPEFRLVDLGELLEGFASQFRQREDVEGVEIAVSVQDGVPMLPADGKQLTQIIINLVDNGIEAMPDGGVITLGATADKETVNLSVADTGEGIAQERLAMVFDEFYTSKPTGTGLGLALCKNLAAQHGAEMTVESEPGKGTKFTVSFKNPNATLESEDDEQSEDEGR